MDSDKIKNLKVKDGPDVITIIPSAKSTVAPGIIFLVVSIVAIRLSQLADFFIISLELGWLIFYVPLLTIFPLLILLRILYRLYDPIYQLTAEEVRTTTGQIWLKSKIADASYEQINGVEIRGNIIDRLLNVGTLAIGTAMTGRNEIKIWGIDRPKFYRDIIIQRINEGREDFPQWYREQFLYD